MSDWEESGDEAAEAPRPPPSSRGGGLRAGRAARLRCTAVVPLGRPRQLPHGWAGARAGL